MMADYLKPLPKVIALGIPQLASKRQPPRHNEAATTSLSAIFTGTEEHLNLRRIPKDRPLHLRDHGSENRQNLGL